MILKYYLHLLHESNLNIACTYRHKKNHSPQIIDSNGKSLKAKYIFTSNKITVFCFFKLSLKVQFDCTGMAESFIGKVHFLPGDRTWMAILIKVD